MKKRKILYLAGLGLATSLALTGCKKTTTGETETETVLKERFIHEALDYYREEPEEKEYAPYEHYFFITYSPAYIQGKKIGNVTIDYTERGSISVPKGYCIVGVSGMSDGSKYTSTESVLIWYTNTEPVIVKPVYNEDIKMYDYSEFGTPIELEKTLN